MLLFSCDKKQAVDKEQEPASEGLETLYNWMAGDFTSAAQAAQDTNYFDISLRMIPIWENQQDGYWLYVEQAVSSMRERPYRQRVYKLQAKDDKHFTSTAYVLPEPKAAVGTSASDSLWLSLNPDSLSLLPGCDIVLEYKDGFFSGGTHKKDCLNNWGDAAYATSEVAVGEDTLRSWDRGWDSTNTQVWGAEKAGYVFVKTKP
jgi:hypothetical protein